MQTQEELLKNPMASRKELESYLDIAVALVKESSKEFTKFFPHSNSEKGFYQQTENVEWTTGFYTGEIWLAYERTQDLHLKEIGDMQVNSFLHRIENKIDVGHHDMGFLYSPSCVAAYQLTGNAAAKKAALLAAEHLMERFQEKGQFFQAWGELGDPDNYRLIIDCLLNMPLLFWASTITKDKKYAQKAMAHIKTAMQCVIRPDHSTYHTYFMNPVTGKPIKGVTHQGNRDGSAWARGQAWGIYGAAFSYREIKDPQYRDIFIKLTDYFLQHLPLDGIPYWDFDFTDGSTEPRDSSALAIAICGILEMAKQLPEKEAVFYTDMAKRLILPLMKTCAVTDSKQSNGLLLYGTYARKSAHNSCNNRGLNECNTWGDYYYLEALTRLTKDWNPYW